MNLFDLIFRKNRGRGDGREDIDRGQSRIRSGAGNKKAFPLEPIMTPSGGLFDGQYPLDEDAEFLLEQKLGSSDMSDLDWNIDDISGSFDSDWEPEEYWDWDNGEAEANSAIKLDSSARIPDEELEDLPFFYEDATDGATYTELSDEDLEELPSFYEEDSNLEDPASDIARILTKVVEDIKAAGRYEHPYHQRLALIALAKSVGDLVLGLAPTSGDRDIISFQKIANLWHRIVTQKVSALAETEFNQEIDSPYIIGVPLSDREEIFVARTDIASQIEQIALDRRRPSLLLYGQRRMGKTSLLKNLGRLLPDNITPLFIDLQGPATRASNNTGFLYNIARGMVKSARGQSGLTLPTLDRSSLETDPFTVFDEWLDKVEEALGQNTALLALDEFEALEGAIAKGRFDPEEVLGMLRNLIQHRPRFKVLLAGSHAIEEFQSWASYLINVQVVKIGYLKESEARQLVERPVKDFALRYEPDAVERILQLTRCHPFLVQLLCQEIVALKNEQNPASRRLATFADVEAAMPAASSSGSFFFADIQNNQVSALGAEVLRFMAARGEAAIIDRSALLRQFPSDLDSTLDGLLRRELIEEAGNGYRFQVESIRRWFA